MNFNFFSFLVLNYCSVAFTLNWDSNRLTWAHVDLLCRNLSVAIDIEYREMVWEGLKRSDRAENVVLVTLMPVKAIINIRELSHETMAELDITKVEIGIVEISLYLAAASNAFL